MHRCLKSPWHGMVRRPGRSPVSTRAGRISRSRRAVSTTPRACVSGSAAVQAASRPPDGGGVALRAGLVRGGRGKRSPAGRGAPLRAGTGSNAALRRAPAVGVPDASIYTRRECCAGQTHGWPVTAWRPQHAMLRVLHPNAGAWQDLMHREGRTSMAHEADDNGSAKMKRKAYEKELERLQAELCMLQDWVKAQGLRVIIIFEGRDAAGKGGTIKAITERVSPRVFRVVALPAPSDREKSQMYAQRYIPHFPAAGEIVIFDRSWYNRLGIEHVMGFCTPEEYQRFLDRCPDIERYIVEGGIKLIKFWLEVGNQEQARRFEARIEDPLRQWKLSPTDLESRRRWYDYSRARDRMLEVTDTAQAPWYIVRSDNKRRARLNCIAHLLSLIPYEKVPRTKAAVPGRATEHAYDDEASLRGRRFVPERY